MCLFFVVNDIVRNETLLNQSGLFAGGRMAGSEGGQMVEYYLQAYWYTEFHCTFISYTSFMVPFES